MKKKPTVQECLTYEIYGTWWAYYVWWEWGHELAAKYFVFKAKRKFNRMNTQFNATLTNR